MLKFRKPFNNIYDFLDATYYIFRFLGIACYTRVKKPDGSLAFIKDNGHNVPSIVYCSLMVMGILPIVLGTRDASDSDLGVAILKTGFSVINLLGIIVTMHFGRNIDNFLNVFKVIDDIDKVLKKRSLVVDYEKFRIAFIGFLLSLSLLPIPCVIVFLRIIKTPPEEFWYDFVQYIIGYVLAFVALCFQSTFYVAVAFILGDRLKILKLHMKKLQSIKNSKIIEQELLTISQIHSKICECWNLTKLVCGITILLTLVMFYVNCLTPPIISGKIKHRSSKGVLIGLMLSFDLSILVLLGSNYLKKNAENFIEGLVELHLKKGNEESRVDSMCKTLLLQIKHLDIDLVVCGCVAVDFQTFFQGMKNSLTLMMFFVSLS